MFIWIDCISNFKLDVKLWYIMVMYGCNWWYDGGNG